MPDPSFHMLLHTRAEMDEQSHQIIHLQLLTIMNVKRYCFAEDSTTTYMLIQATEAIQFVSFLHRHADPFLDPMALNPLSCRQ
jgi:hypothetical protein